MFWKVSYTVDTGYEWSRKICIIKADTEEEAQAALAERIGAKLSGERVILDKYTRIELLNSDDVVIYDGYR